MPNVALFPAHGAQAERPSRYKPVWTDRFFQGYYTNRNLFRSPLSSFYAEGWGLGKTDALINPSLNVELSPRLTIARRPGWITQATLPFPITGISAFRALLPSANPNRLIVDTTVGPYLVKPTGNTALFVKSLGAGITRVLGLGSTAFLANGVDLFAWTDGGTAPNPRNWGISIGTFSGPSGPNQPTTGVDVAVTGGAAWANPSNVTSGGATFASVSLGANTPISSSPTSPVSLSGMGTSLPVSVSVSAGQTSAALIAQNFQFTIPLDATILGVTLSTTRVQNSGTSAMLTGNIGLTGIASTTKADVYPSGEWTGTATPVTYGSSSDLWGTSGLTPAIVNSSAFGVSLQVTTTGSPGNGAAGVFSALTLTISYSVAQASQSDYLQAAGYNFNFPNTTLVQGISVTLTGYQTAGAGSLSVQLISGGQVVGTAKTGITLPTSSGNVSMGGSGDLWGVSMGAAEFGGAGFGVAIQANNPSGSVETWDVGNAKITIYGTGGVPISVLSASGSMSATKGYQYVVAYGNSNSGHISTSTPASANTGVFSSKQGVQLSLTASTDPQVNQIWVFRTTDGGSLFFATAGSPYPNVTQNVTDATVDTSLNILMPAPINSENNPPPAGATNPVYHMGRVWVSVGSVLYASGGPDTITGNGAEAFPPLNYLEMPSTITRMVSTATGLVVFMTDRIQIVAGGPQMAMFYVQPLLDGIGVLNYDAIDIYGSQAYVFTSDRQFLTVDMSSGVSEPGFPIEDQLRQLDPTIVSVAYHTNGLDRGVFVADGEETWYRVVPQQPPDFSITGPVWSPPGQLSSGTLSLLKSVQTSDGNRQLLCANGSVLGYRDSSFGTFTDFGASYHAYFTIGSIVLANPGQMAELGFITSDFVRVGASPSVSVLLDEISGEFSGLPSVTQDPPLLYGAYSAPSSLYSNRYYFRQSPTGGGPPLPAWCRHMQINIDFGFDFVQNEILSNTVWGTILEEASS